MHATPNKSVGLILTSMLVVASMLGVLYVSGIARRTTDAPGGLQPLETSLAEILTMRPEPQWSPGRVVQAQLDALRVNDSLDDAGIAVCFEFTSPRNREITGPLARFTRLIKSPDYRALVNHADVLYGNMLVHERSARIPVLIRTQHGRVVAYLFELSHQTDEPYADCWMTDSVIVMPPGLPRMRGNPDASGLWFMEPI